MQAQSYQTFQVPSSGRLGVVHTVTLWPADGVTDCTCEDSRSRRRQCRHQRFVLAVYTFLGRSGALVAQHEVAQAAQAPERESAHGHAAYAEGVARCRCGWQSSPTVDALVELSQHMQGERAAERAYLYDSEADLAAVRRITRAIS